MSARPVIGPDEVYREGSGAAGFTVLDVRAPAEVSRGALPGSVNIPILEDDERHRVGIAYKEEGQRAAVDLGIALTSEEMPRRVERWREVSRSALTAIACWRGGMRSELAQSYLGEPWIPRVAGGYKALRAHLMQGLEPSLSRHELVVVGGLTGTGKTELIESLRGTPGVLSLDLEGLANHRGSAFGHQGEQPAQQSFENEIAARLILDPGELLVVEDESRRIGALHLPDALFARMTGARVVLLEAPFEERIERIHRQYVFEPALERGPEIVIEELSEAVSRLRKRLGGSLVADLQEVLGAALEADSWRESRALEPFIGPLLSEYYDPLYCKSVDQLQREVVASGSFEELTSWVSQQQ